MANVQLTEDVKEILSRATISGNNLHLPPQQLDRKLYEAVNKAIVNMGGKWVTKAKAHVFTSDPTPKLQQALGTGVAVDEKKLYQAFFTPDDLAYKLVEMADVRNQKVLEPSAGRGSIARKLKNAGASEIVCVEVNEEFAAYLREQGLPTLTGDFLETLPTPTFDRVVMNPPFTKNQDIAYVNHALKWLRSGGVLVAVMLDNQQRPKFKELIWALDYEIEELPRGTFKEAGTPVGTLILTIRTD